MCYHPFRHEMDTDGPHLHPTLKLACSQSKNPYTRCSAPKRDSNLTPLFGKPPFRCKLSEVQFDAVAEMLGLLADVGFHLDPASRQHMHDDIRATLLSHPGGDELNSFRRELKAWLEHSQAREMPPAGSEHAGVWFGPPTCTLP